MSTLKIWLLSIRIKYIFGLIIIAIVIYYIFINIANIFSDMSKKLF